MPWTVAPWDLTAFVGRDAERAALRELALAREGEPALATLYGIAGAGKTRLARVVAGELERSMPGGRVFASAEDGPGGLADALGAPAGGGDAVERAAHALTLRERTLVILDHAGAPVDAVEAALPAWLSAGAHVFLVAARAPLALRGARRIAVGPLAPDEAAALLAARLQELGAERLEPAVARRLVEAIGGLPLAIELVAGSLRTRSAAEVERRLASGAALALTSEDRDLPERHRSLERALDETWEELAEAEQLALALAAGFGGAFEAEAYDAVAARVAGAAPVDRLVARGLVARVGETLEVIACLRALARERVGAAETRELAVAHVEAALEGAVDERSAGRLLAAGHELLPSGAGVRALLAGARALERRGEVARRRTAVAAACTAAEGRLEAEAHVMAAELARAAGDVAGARVELDRVSDPSLAAEVAIVEAQLAIDRAEDATVHLDRAVALAQTGHVRARALAARFAARLVQAAPFDEADGLAALAELRAAGDQVRVGQMLANLGLAALHRGDHALASERLAHAHVTATGAGDAVVECGATLFAGLAALDQGHTGPAAVHLARAEALALDLGRLSLWSDAVGYGALARLEAGEPTALAALASHVREMAARGMAGSAPLFAAALHLLDPAHPPPPPPSDRRPLIDEAVRILTGGDAPAAPYGVQVRLALRLRRRAAAPARAPRERLTVARDRAGFTRGDAVVDLARRGPLRRIFAELVLRHATGRGPATADDLIAAGWPGESIQPEAARMRLHNAIAALRSMGLRGVLETSADGYRLAADVAIDQRD